MFSIICSAQIFINEVCADNENIIEDESGDYEDWIELYNAGNSSINLEGYFLSDDPDQLDKWIFPDIEIPAAGYLLVFASDKNYLGQYPHTNFKVSKDGESIVLSDPQLEIIDQLDVPAMEADNSYGRLEDGQTNFGFFFTPSPGVTNNGNPSFNFAAPPVFRNDQFFSPDPILVDLECPQENCQIYYTIDGSVPDENDYYVFSPFLCGYHYCLTGHKYYSGFISFGSYYPDIFHQYHSPTPRYFNLYDTGQPLGF